VGHQTQDDAKVAVALMAADACRKYKHQMIPNLYLSVIYIA